MHERILPAVSRLVPAPRRSEWRLEWQAEFWQLRHPGHGLTRAHGGRRESLSLSYGLMADAAWLRLDWLRMSARRSALSCLIGLAAYCLLCATTELVIMGSWHGFVGMITAHFMGGYVFVAVPGVIAALATYPLRPLRCEEMPEARLSSARTRWNLFLGAKVTLTLALAFLFAIVVCQPVRAVIGGRADWIELLLWAVLVTASLRWALLNQEQRCQKCLRMLSQPTRVGMSSRNFLDWSGMELACADGHGLLHVAEMPGSWCWYDTWTISNPEWSGLFTA
jgi:hypothetical protein